jgi:prephenate dehydrogenase
LFKKVCIYGVGLIGGSLGLALKKRELAKEIIGLGRRVETLNKAKDKSAVDKITLNFEEALKDAELFVICVPVRITPEIFNKCLASKKGKILVTDVGSTKENIVKQIEKSIDSSDNKGIEFIGSHPMAGSEKAGVTYADKNLFEGSVTVLTPTKNSSSVSLELLKKIWQAVGSEVKIMSPKDHDMAVAIVSHLPHMLAYSLVGVLEENYNINSNLLSLISSGFKDTTRIAGSSADVWKDIALDNKDNIIKAIEKFETVLRRLKSSISQEKEEEILEQFKKFKEIRDKIK